MGKNGAIAAVIVIMVLLLLAIATVWTYQPPTGSKIKEENSNRISASSKHVETISFEEKVKSFTDETNTLLEPCTQGMQYALEDENPDYIKRYLDTCYSHLSGQKVKLQALEKEALTRSEKREIDALKLAMKINENSFDFIQEIVDFVENAPTMTLEEGKSEIQKIDDRIAGLISQVDRLRHDYQGTYYYEEYLDTPESAEALAFMKGQADVFHELVVQMR